jgi:hypothetical protein
MDTKLVRLEYELGSFRLLPVYYAFLVGIVYAALSGLVHMIGFTVISTLIFLLFFTIISFLGLTLQRIAKAYRAIPPKPTVTGFIAEQFYLPILAVGKWVSDVIASNNVFIIVMDHFIEGTFKRFVDAIERWTAYMKEKREDAMS